jgi:GT2 family glycosyltransferase
VSSTGVVLKPDGCFEDRDAGRDATASSAAPDPFCPTAAAALWRRTMLDAALLSCGWFDAGHFAYFEDADLGWRCRLAGFEARYVPDAVVLHAEHASAARQASGFVERMCRRNRVRTLAKNASWRFLLRCVPRLVRDAVAEALWGPAELRAWIQATRDGLARRREVERVLRVPRTAVERRWVERGTERDATR